MYAGGVALDKGLNDGKLLQSADNGATGGLGEAVGGTGDVFKTIVTGIGGTAVPGP